MRYLIAFILILSASSAVFAETWVNSLFTDGMVLQRDSAVKIWGSDKAGQAIKVSINKISAKTKADAQGNWSLNLKPMKAGGPYTLTINGSSEKTIKDVLIGEVWLCSGQSNMASPLQWYKKLNTNPQSDSNAQLRMFTVKKSAGGDKAKDVSGTWKKADGDISKWSATPYHFGSFLQKHFKVPVGIINSSVGGTPLESWCDHAVLDTLPELKGHVGWINGQIKKGKWEANNPWRPAGLFNHMIHPLVGYTINGATWYQGESNANRASVYGNCFKAMITDWRKQWGQGDFPFITVQLANHIPKNHKKDPQSWAVLREAQNESLSLPNTGLAVAIDIGDPTDIHPANKKDVAYRLFLNARKLAYEEDLIYSGPLFKSCTFKSDSAIVSFDHIGDGLKASGKLSGWEIAGADKQYVSADAEIKGDTVAVKSADIKEPKFVRYGWNNNPNCNLYNSADLPASPFRSAR